MSIEACHKLLLGEIPNTNYTISISLKEYVSEKAEQTKAAKEALGRENNRTKKSGRVEISKSRQLRTNVLEAFSNSYTPIYDIYDDTYGKVPSRKQTAVEITRAMVQDEA